MASAALAPAPRIHIDRDATDIGAWKYAVMPISGESVRLRLREALGRALKERDRVAVDAIRSTLSAIDNAEAVPDALNGRPPEDGPIAGAARGLGAADVPRRTLTEGDIRTIVVREIAEKRSASLEYARLGRHEESSRLRSQADLLEAELN